MKSCNLNEEALAALARGDLGPSEAAETAAHAADCATCKAELAWLRTEARMFARREAPEVPSHVWQGIERRMVINRERQRRSRQTWFRAGGLVAVAAAAALVVILPRPRPEPLPIDAPSVSVPAPKASAAANLALEGAEKDYQQAIAALEAEYATKRARMAPETAQKYDAELARMRETVASTREVAAVDVGGRRHALRAYSAYMRSMQAIVLEDDQ